MYASCLKRACVQRRLTESEKKTCMWSRVIYSAVRKIKAAKREIPLMAVAQAIIKRRVNDAKGEYLFPHRSDKDKPMLKVNNTHASALKNSKVKTFSLYDLRHTWATRVAEAGFLLATGREPCGNGCLRCDW